MANEVYYSFVVPFDIYLSGFVQFNILAILDGFDLGNDIDIHANVLSG
ncbi:MAG: hypothetical protein QF535_11680 [Anaerolineales bacterium]|nr:hypothetical protein [Anaerolineales bacterium]